LIQAGRPAEALRYLERASMSAPSEVNVQLAYAHALVLNGKRDAARQRLKRVLQLDPTNATATNALRQLGAP
ncbi:MAG: tetratricopeptide repeat protein, partial [Pseudomonadota bacterium]